MKSKMKLAALFVSMAMITSVAFQTVSAVGPAAITGSTSITASKTNKLENPLGIDDATPSFSWQMESNVIGRMQTAYQIVVTNEKTGAVVWDSNRVESELSSAIEYEGEALDAQTPYSWTVTVWDNAGGMHTTEPATFETGLMSTSLDAWSGAEWVGADELILDAASAALFDLNMDFTIPEGSTSASIVFGADDFRLNNEYLNIWRKGGENYFKYQIDVSDPAAPVLKIYVVGMPVKGQSVENDAAEPDFTVDLSSVINAENAHAKHSIQIATLSNINQINCAIDGVTVDKNRQLNPLGSGHNYNSFPNLNSIGFAAESGQQAVYENIHIVNRGAYSSILFDENTGATYEIFKGLDGVTVNEDNTISVNGGENGIVSYADPSYGSAPMLRTEFNADKEIASARMYVSAQGIYEMYINGERMGDDWFNPGNSEYRERIAYHTYDVTDMLKTGENAIGAMLGEGWWSGYQSYTAANYNFYGDKQALMAKLDITYTDGTTATITTDDATWDYYGNGPIRYGDNFQGERYDATLEAAVDGWATADYDASSWRDSVVIAPAREELANYEMVTRYDEPAHVVNVLTAKECLGESRPGSGSYIYDMGENVICVPQIDLPEGSVSAGDEITLRFAEILYPDNLEEYTEADIDGMLMVENYRAAMSTDFYTCKDGAQTIEPSFTFHGYRYIEITGLDEPLPCENVKSLILSSVEMDGTYESSNELTNRLYKNVQNSQTSNFLSLPTDCPQRNERMGWTGDAQVFSRASTYNADTLNFYRQWLVTLRDSQGENGSLPVTAPQYSLTPGHPGSGFMGISWDAALTNIPWQLYRQYGDTQVIEENIDAIYKYLNYLAANPMNESYPNLTSKTGVLADWLSVDSTDATLINNAVYIYLMDIASTMAEVVGRTDMAEVLDTRYDLAKAEWNKLYIDPETCMTRNASGAIQNTQASYATPLAYNVISDEYRFKAAEHLAEAVRNPQNPNVKPYTITTGFSGTPNVVPVLTQYGYIDDAFKLFESTEYASWLYPVTQGATSIWERWNSYTVEGGFNGNNSMNSFNHFSLGAISEWMFGYQLGITGNDADPGYHNFILQPTVGGDFTFANGSFESVYGTIKSGWDADGAGNLTSYSATVPANSTATLYLPVSADTAAGFKNMDGVTYLGMVEHNGQDCAMFELQSGGYTFSVADGSLSVSVQEGYVAESAANKTILRSVLAYAEAQYASDEFDNVIASVQQSFTAALENARAVDADLSASQDAVDSAWQSLMTEIHKLGFVRGDKSTLTQLVEISNSYNDNIGLYTPATADPFVAAFTSAKAVLADGDAMQEDVATAESALLNAMMNLRYKADKSVLESVLAQANDLDLSAYSEADLAAFNAAKAAAEAVYSDVNAEQDAADDAASNLQAAIASLTGAPADTTISGTPTQGDAALTTAGGNAKTGEAAPIALAVATVSLAGAAILFSKKRSR